jgi:hypothetical protein
LQDAFAPSIDMALQFSLHSERRALAGKTIVVVRFHCVEVSR